MTRLGIALLAGICLTSSHPLAETVQSGLDALERSAARFEQKGTAFESTKTKVSSGDLDALRKSWMTDSRYRRLAQDYAKTNEPEVLFRLARHAYLLKHGDEAANWVKRIPDTPAALEWTAKGTYILGAMAVQSGNRPRAKELFTQALASAELTRSEVTADVRLALARIAFDEGKYEEAREYYGAIQKSSPRSQEDSLDESAWTYLKLGRPDLASTNIDLLFALYPQSDRLPNAGFLLGKILETKESLEGGVRTLERLAFRFAFEKQGVEKALAAYAGREEELLFEFLPEDEVSDALAILPTTGRHLLEQDSTVRQYLAEIRELRERERDLNQGDAVAAAGKLALRGAEGATIDSVTLLDWANDLERSLLGVAKSSSLEIDRIQELRKLVDQSIGEAEEARKGLIEVDRHVSLSWQTLGGQREREALEIKRGARRQLRTIETHKTDLIRQFLTLDALELRARRALVLNQESELRAKRGDRPELASTFARLDAIRKKVKEGEKPRVAQLRAEFSKLEATIRRDRTPIEKAQRDVLRRARGNVRDVLRENLIHLSNSLSLYQWSIAEARYKYLRALEKELANARVQNVTALELVDERYKPFAAPVPVEKIPEALAKSHSAHDEFARASSEFIQEVNSRVKARIDHDRERYEEFTRGREDQLIDQQETRREQAIFAYQQFIANYPKSDRAPYALYRVAQLHYERAEMLSRMKNQKNLFQFATAPLKRIQKEFPTFPHRDSALYLLGYAHLEAGETRESARVFEELVAQFPRSRLVPEIELRIGEHYFAERQFKQAIPHYQAVLSTGFNYFYDKALYKLAWANYLTGRFDSAIAHFLILLDYSEALTAEQRKQFIEFSDEAIEYVAFSLFRSGGTAAAESIFSKTGWKPYSEKVLSRMAEIYSDRGDFRGALAAYRLSAEKFGVSALLPNILENRIKLFERLNDMDQARTEKERALRLLAEDSSWRKQNQENRTALMAADQLNEKMTYSLATQYEEKGQRKEAENLYRQVSVKFPQGVQAYNSQYRLAELAFLRGDFQQAVLDYDVVGRNDRFSHHFNDALFGIVICRDRAIQERGGVDSVIAKSDDANPEAIKNLTNAIENFIQRAPKDPRVAEASYLSASVYTKVGDYDRARTAYLRIAEKYPESKWADESIFAAIDTYFAQERWDEAADFCGDMLKTRVRASADMKTRLAKLEEKAKFKGAEALTEKDPPKALAGFFAFQKRFPESELAPKAIFNAFAIGKRIESYREAESALTLLIDRYARAPESENARFERALIYDAQFDLDRAIPEYESIAKLPPKDKVLRTVALNLANLYAVSGSPAEAAGRIATFSTGVPDPERSELELLAVDLYRQAKSDLIWPILDGLSRRSTAPALERVRAAALASQLYWAAGREKDAQLYETVALRLAKALNKKERSDGDLAIAQAGAVRLSRRRVNLAGHKMESKTAAELVTSFKKKARLLAEMEQAVLQLLKLHSVRASARSLFELGNSYQEFTTELEALKLPAGEEVEFKRVLPTLTTPLRTKTKEAFSKSFELLSDARLPEPYFEALVDQLRKNGVMVEKLVQKDLQWIEPRLPPPAFVRPKPTAEKIARMPAIILLASAAPSLRDRPAALREFEEGLKAAEKMGSAEDRQKAIEFFGKALNLDPIFPEALYDLTMVQLFHGDHAGYGSALTRIERFPGNVNPLDLARLKATYYLVHGEGASAIDPLNTILESDPRNEWAHWTKTVALLMAGKKAEARKSALLFLRQRPRSIEAHRALASSLRFAQEFRFAETVLRRALAMAPKRADLLNELALSLNRPDDLLAKTTLFEEAARSEEAEPLGNWANLAYLVHRSRDALKDWEKASVATGRNHPGIEINLSLAKRQMGEAE